MQKLASVLAGPPEVAQEGLQEAANRLCGLGGGVPGTPGGIPGPPGGGVGGGGGMPPRLVKFRCEVPARSGDADRQDANGLPRTRLSANEEASFCACWAAGGCPGRPPAWGEAFQA